MSEALYGLVLSGGKSSRMGFDKGTINYHGRPQRNYLFDLLSKSCEKVYTSCMGENRVEPELNPIIDVYTFNSPLSGILTAFSLHPMHAWLVVAIDLPNVDQSVIQKLTDERDPSKMATCFFDDNAQAPEPLITIWEPEAYPLLMSNAQKGNVSPRNFLRTNDVHIIRNVPSEWFVNVNSPEDQLGLTTD